MLLARFMPSLRKEKKAPGRSAPSNTGAMLSRSTWSLVHLTGKVNADLLKASESAARLYPAFRYVKAIVTIRSFQAYSFTRRNPLAHFGVNACTTLTDPGGLSRLTGL